MTMHTMTVPDLGEGVVEAEVVAWLVAVGDHVTTGTPIAEVLTDKASVEVSAPVTGRVDALLVDAGAIAPVGSPLVRFTSDDGPDSGGADTTTESLEASPPEQETVPAHPAATVPPPEPAAVPAASAQSAPVAPTGARPRRPSAAPTVRRAAKERGIDLAHVQGTGPHGRIVLADLDRPAPTERRATPRQPDEVVPVRGLRRTIARRLEQAWTAPHITYVEEVDVSSLEALRSELNAERPSGERFTMLPFIARAIVMACRRHPTTNAHFDAEGESLSIHGAVHLGVATQTTRGLVVPVVRDADERSLSSLSTAIRTLSASARDGTISRDDLTGSTITVTSLGALGGVMNTPILNAPEVSIVGVNRLRTVGKWTGAAWVPTSVINLSASFDHRIIDGYDAALFVTEIKRLLESPALLSFGWDV